MELITISSAILIPSRQLMSSAILILSRQLMRSAIPVPPLPVGVHWS